MELKTPEQLVSLLNQVPLTAKEKVALNKELANHTRRYFRSQIRAQRDINNKAYAPRKRRKASFNTNGKVSTSTNMFLGLSRNIKTEVNADSFSVGLAGLEGHIAKVHNQGDSVIYPRRINGWFNAKTNSWEGGKNSGTAAYKMPKRTLIGWTNKLTRELTQKIVERMQPR